MVVNIEFVISYNTPKHPLYHVTEELALILDHLLRSFVHVCLFVLRHQLTDGRMGNLIDSGGLCVCEASGSGVGNNTRTHTELHELLCIKGPWLAEIFSIRGKNPNVAYLAELLP